jgi:iron complex transport system ATP-binding protein
LFNNEDVMKKASPVEDSRLYPCTAQSARRVAHMTILDARDLTFAYGERRVLDGVSFHVKRGQVLSLLGPNGSGKSTLLKILLGLLQPRSGSVLLNAQPVGALDVKQRARKMAYVPQAHTLSFPYRVIELVLLGRLAHQSFLGSCSQADRRLACEALQRMGIEHLAMRSYAAISGGERQLALIARALAQGAKVLIMDEPVAGLDYGNQLRLLQEIRTLASDGYTIVKSTHFPDHAFLSSDAVILLHQGKILAHGAPEEVMTTDTLRQLYGVEVRIVSRDGLLSCVPMSRLRRSAVAGRMIQTV